MRLSAALTSDYSLAVTTNRRLEVEPNASVASNVRTIAPGLGALGLLAGGEVSFASESNPGGFVDISATGNVLSLSDDSAATITTTVGNAAFPAGPVTVANNGGIISGAGANLSATNGSLPASSFGTAFLPFWDDIDADTGAVFWEERVLDGINTLIVQWDNRPHFSNIGSATFQVQVPASGNTIARFAYQDVDFGDPSFNNGASATIGYQANSGSAFTYGFNTTSVFDGDVVSITTQDDDVYQLDLAAGQSVVLTTATPLDNPSHTPLNDVDPALTIADAGGGFLAGDDNSAADGKNAQLSFTAATSGSYFVTVSGQAGSGEYLLNVSGGLSGDFDSDGDLDCDDIDALTRAAAAGTNDPQFDVTGDNAVDLADVNEWVLNLKGTLIGDANLDFTVDVSDFNLWSANKFTTGTAWCSGDFNANGVTDVSDFNLWSANKFTTTANPLLVVLKEIRPEIVETRVLGGQSEPLTAAARVNDFVLAAWSPSSSVDEELTRDRHNHRSDVRGLDELLAWDELA